MDKEYLFYYTESMIVCIIIFAILLVHDLVKGDRQEKKFRFDNVLLAHILYFICDGVWAGIIGGALPRTTFSVLLVNYLLLFLLALMGNCWFFFTTVLMNMPKRATKRGKMMIYAPMTITCVIALIGMIIKPSAWVTPENEMTLLYSVFFILAPVIYLVNSFLYAVYQASKKENMLNRKLYLFTGAYPLTLIFAGLFQVMFVGAPIFCYSCTIMIILFNLISMEEQISVDPLTKLNNRGQLMRFATQDSSIHKEGMRTFVVMADVNGFKKINDTYGHAEGDNALIMIADALRHAAENMKIAPFLGRYGGDEFVLITNVDKKDSADDVMNMLIEEISQDLAKRCARKQMPYTITLGFGYDELGPSDEFTDSMQRADQKLYEDKARRKLTKTE